MARWTMRFMGGPTGRLAAGALLLCTPVLEACSKSNDVEQPNPACSNSIKDATESDIDCGGSCSSKCDNGRACLGHIDCKSAYCLNGVCQDNLCTDHVQDGAETDVDCGGASCERCDNGEGCRADADCKSGSCVGESCRAPSCTDDKHNQDETDVDCGGQNNACERCADGRACKVNDDCKNHVCSGDICASARCSDGVQNGTETDKDCGGADTACSRCGNTKTCNGDADCQTPLVCEGKVCACKARTDCPGEDSLCGSRTCSAGVCGMASQPAGDVTGPLQCLKYTCDGAGNVQTSNQPMGMVCTDSGGNRCNGAGACERYAIFNDPTTPFGDGKFGP